MFHQLFAYDPNGASHMCIYGLFRRSVITHYRGVQRKAWALNKCDISVSVSSLMRWTRKKTHLFYLIRGRTQVKYSVSLLNCAYQPLLYLPKSSLWQFIIHMAKNHMWKMLLLCTLYQQGSQLIGFQMKSSATHLAMRNPLVSLSHNLVKVTKRCHQSN